MAGEPLVQAVPARVPVRHYLGGAIDVRPDTAVTVTIVKSFS